MEMNHNQKTEGKKSPVRSASPTRSTTQDSPMQECIDLCLDCSTTCLQLIPYCLNEGKEHADPTHVLLLQNCAEICRTSANFMISNSAFSADVCKVCADVCKQCADDCEGFGDDEMMKQCAEICRACADSCQSMTKMA